MAFKALALLSEGAHLPKAEAGNARLLGLVCDGGGRQDALVGREEEVTDESERVRLLLLPRRRFGLHLLLLVGRGLDTHLPSHLFGLLAHALLEALAFFDLCPYLRCQCFLASRRVWCVCTKEGS